MRRALSHRADWPIWIREWFGHHVDRCVAHRIRSGQAGWLAEDWILRQHRRRFGLAAFIRSDYGLEPPSELVALFEPTSLEVATTGSFADELADA